MNLLATVRRTIRRHGLAQPGTRVLVAVSGGSDSVALACLLRELAAAGELQIAGLAHFNHQLRDTAARDEAAVAALARALGWPAAIDREDVAARARRDRQSIEHAAREARYAFLNRARIALGADRVALGHTRDDQAETFLMRLVRGAGARGLAAMHPSNGAIIRPLLDCRREALRRFLRDRGIAYVEDESNADTAMLRNRVRAELLPLIEQRFNPAIVDVLADAAALARDEWAWMEAAAAELLDGAGREAAGPRVVLDVAKLAAAPVALRRAALWRAMTRASGGRTIPFAHVEQALELLDGCHAGRTIDAPGVIVERTGAAVVLTGKPPRGRGRPSRSNLFSYSLSIPGEIAVPEAGVSVSAELASAGTASDSAAVAVLRSDVPAPLTVRNRRPGDRFSPPGLDGRKKLQDYFVDRKVPRGERDRIPVVVDATGRIVWVGGYAADAEFRVPEAAQSVLLLRLKLLGGSA